MSSSSARLGVITLPESAPGLAPAQQPEDHRQRRYELVNCLQSSLDLVQQLAIFQQWLQHDVVTDGLTYRHPQQLDIKLGNQSCHRCNYRLNTEDECLGEIEFARASRFNEEELSQIESALSALLYPVRNALHYHLAVQTALRDPLTGTGNRIALDNALRRECQLAERYAQAVSLVILDIDRFKQINDNHGHSIGDQVLQAVANRIRNVTRETDMIFRYGGEEFVVVLSKTDTEGASLTAERLRQTIADQGFTTPDGEINVTVSVGASSLRERETIKALFDRTDEALYLAKGNGRNCVVSL